MGAPYHRHEKPPEETVYLLSSLWRSALRCERPLNLWSHECLTQGVAAHRAGLGVALPPAISSQEIWCWEGEGLISALPMAGLGLASEPCGKPREFQGRASLYTA